MRDDTANRATRDRTTKISDERIICAKGATNHFIPIHYDCRKEKPC